jgi:hypothetical protein
MRITASSQEKLQDLLKSQEYVIRYEKGNFKGGYCVVQDQRTVIINKFHPIETKINLLLEIIRSLEIDESRLSAEQAKLLERIRKNEPAS